MADLRYKDIENALIAALGVPKNGVGALRARIRHLRKFGVPKLEKVGSGTHLTYSRVHALELMLAIKLELYGASRREVAEFARSGAKAFFEQKGLDNVYLVITRSLNINDLNEPWRFSVQKTRPGHIFSGKSVAGVHTAMSVTLGTKRVLNQFRQLTRSGREMFAVNLSACNSALPADWEYPPAEWK